MRYTSKKVRIPPFSFVEKVWLKIGAAQNAIADAQKLLSREGSKVRLKKQESKNIEACSRNLKDALRELSLAMMKLGQSEDKPPKQRELFETKEEKYKNLRF